MWRLYDYISIFKSKQTNDVINTLFWYCVILGFIHYYFGRYLRFFLRKSQIKSLKHSQTITFLWNICFNLAAFACLNFYHFYFIAPLLEKESGKFFPKYKNIIFLKTCDTFNFKILSMMLVSYNVVNAVLNLRERDFSEFAANFLHGCVLLCCYSFGLENFSILLSITLSAFLTISECLMLTGLHSSFQQTWFINILVSFKFVSWLYVFCNIIPLKFLIPLLYANNVNIFLKIFAWLWYISCVWNSPISKYLYHFNYHLNSFDCIGKNEVARCILLKDSEELRHSRTLMKAYLELQLSRSRKQSHSTKSASDSNVNKTFQTIKCMMTLKRKLKRIRQERQLTGGAISNGGGNPMLASSSDNYGDSSNGSPNGARFRDRNVYN